MGKTKVNFILGLTDLVDD